MRRRATSAERAFQYFDVMAEVQPERLKALGACILSWNWIEGAIDTGLSVALELHPDLWTDVTSRINGLDGKIAILKAAAPLYKGVPPEYLLNISKTLNAVANHKRYRDGVVHVRLVHPDAMVADTTQRKGVTDEVLVSKEALEGLYARLSILQQEMDDVVGFFYYRWLGVTAKPAEKQRSAAQELLRCMVQLPDLQRQREQLPPLPEFPDPPQATEATEAAPAPQG